MELTRRSFVRNAALAGGAVAASAAFVAPASADEGEEATEEEATAAASEMECDVVVVGLGSSGLMASVGAAKQGASVVAVDRAAALAGTTNCFTHGPFIVGSKLQLQYDNPLTVQEAATYLQDRSHYGYNSQSLRSILETTGRCADILIDDAGFTFDNSPFPESTPESEIINRAAHTYGVQGAERAEMFQTMLDANGVQCVLGTQATELIMDDGKAPACAAPPPTARSTCTQRPSCCARAASWATPTYRRSTLRAPRSSRRPRPCATGRASRWRFRPARRSAKPSRS